MTRRTRVLLFTNTRLAGGLVGGMEKHMELIGRYLDRDRFEVFAMCSALDGLQPVQDLLRDATDDFAAITVDYAHPSGIPRFVAQLRRWKIDVLHIHNSGFMGQYLAVLAARLGGVKRVFVSEHNAPWEAMPLKIRVDRFVFDRLVTGIICVSEKNRTTRAGQFGNSGGHALVVENGIDVSEFSPVEPERVAALRAKHRLSDDAEVVGTIIRFEPDKGLQYLVEAMPRVLEARPNARLVLVGDGSKRRELEQQAERLGISDRVVFTGFQPDPKAYYGLIDVFVLPVPAGSASIALLEAMAMRRAVIITFGGKGEAVVHRETGMAAEPRNPDAIADAAIEILSDSTFKERLQSSARRHIEGKFSAQAMVRKLERIYTA